MSIHGKGIRGVTFLLVVILAGCFCLSAWAPEADGEKGKADNSTSVASASGEEDPPGVQEQEAPAKMKKKHFPWFWVAAGVVVVGVVLYFTVIKKPEYKLTVSVGTGVSGTPASGTVTYKKGKKVSYSFKLQDGYKDLRVYLNGTAFSAAGEIEMNRHHYLVAAASEVLYYDLTVTLGAGVTGTPAAGVTTHKEMTSVAYNYAAESGYKNLKVQADGVDAPAQGTLLMDRSHALSVTAEKKPGEVIYCGPVSNWHFKVFCSSGKVSEHVLKFIGCGSQKVYWVGPIEGGIGFWNCVGWDIEFDAIPAYWGLVCPYNGGAMALTGEKAESQARMDCKGSFSDCDHMSGTFVAKDEWGYLGDGTWSAQRL